MAALLRLRSRRLLRAWAGSAAAFLPLPFPLALAGRPSAGTVQSDRCPVCGALLVLVPVRQLSAKAVAILTEAAQGALVHYKFLEQADCLSAGIWQQCRGAAWDGLLSELLIVRDNSAAHWAQLTSCAGSNFLVAAWLEVVIVIV